MTDQISGITGNLPGGGVGGLSGTLQGGISNLTNMASSFLDRIIPPQQREHLMEKLSKFATERPVLASFLLSQIVLSGGPIALFVLMTITVFVFALLAGLVAGLIGVLLFILGALGVALGVALFVLLPTLFFTTFFATALWMWGTGAYFIIKWFNQKKVPGIHVPLKDGLLEQTGLKGLSANTSPGDGKSDKSHRNHATNKEKPRADTHSKSNGSPAPRTKTSIDRQVSDASEADHKVHEHKEKTTKPRKHKESSKVTVDEAVQQVTNPLSL